MTKTQERKINLIKKFVEQVVGADCNNFEVKEMDSGAIEFYLDTKCSCGGYTFQYFIGKNGGIRNYQNNKKCTGINALHNYSWY